MLKPSDWPGEKYGTTFIIIVHTNKQVGLWGRKRIADSADIWDIARSVLIAGEANDGLRYISQEKAITVHRLRQSFSGWIPGR